MLRVAAAIEESVPADVLTTALYTRFRSRQDHTFAEKLLSALLERSRAITRIELSLRPNGGAPQTSRKAIALLR